MKQPGVFFFDGEATAKVLGQVPVSQPAENFAFASVCGLRRALVSGLAFGGWIRDCFDDSTTGKDRCFMSALVRSHTFGVSLRMA